MARYTLINPIGEGSFGSVHKAIDNQTGQFVAIKILKPGCDPNSYMSEVHALRLLQHPHIVGLNGVGHERGSTFLVFEYMNSSLWDLIRHRRTIGAPFSEAEIKSFTLQLLLGLDFMHRHRGFMHRDLKPDNLLVDTRGVLKISDLGTATKIESSESLFHSHRVGTRAYQAPEMLRRVFIENERLRPFEYGEKVDMWAAGVMIAELHLMGRLFRTGRYSEDQLHEICKVKGAPNWEAWEGWPELYPEEGVGFRKLMPFASEDAIDLIEALCSWEPENRPSAAAALRHPFVRRPSVPVAAVPVVLPRRHFPVVNGDLTGLAAPLHRGFPNFYPRPMMIRYGGQHKEMTSMQLARVH